MPAIRHGQQQSGRSRFRLVVIGPYTHEQQIKRDSLEAREAETKIEVQASISIGVNEPDAPNIATGNFPPHNMKNSANFSATANCDAPTFPQSSSTSTSNVVRTSRDVAKRQIFESFDKDEDFEMADSEVNEYLDPSFFSESPASSTSNSQLTTSCTVSTSTTNQPSISLTSTYTLKLSSPTSHTYESENEDDETPSPSPTLHPSHPLLSTKPNNYNPISFRHISPEREVHDLEELDDSDNDDQHLMEQITMCIAGTCDHEWDIRDYEQDVLDDLLARGEEVCYRRINLDRVSLR